MNHRHKIFSSKDLTPMNFEIYNKIYSFLEIRNAYKEINKIRKKLFKESPSIIDF